MPRRRARLTCLAPARVVSTTTGSARVAARLRMSSMSSYPLTRGISRSVITASTDDSASRRRASRSEEHTSELQSLAYLVCRLLLEKKKKIHILNGYVKNIKQTV